VKLKFIGGCKQIGGQAIALEQNEKVYLFDYGVYMNDKPKLPPLDVSVKNLQLLFLTHAHLDHSGGMPVFFSGYKIPDILMTPATKILTKILIKDMLKLSEYYLPFGFNELVSMLDNSIMLNSHVLNWNHMKGIRFMPIDSGHIPGSVSFICELDGKRILYTGDVNHRETKLLNGMINEFPSVDYVIIESTYGGVDHPPRQEIEKDFIESIKKVIYEKKGTVLVPAFGVGRSQEIMCILHHYNVKFPVFMDGMARTVSKALLDYKDDLRDVELYKNALKNTTFISNSKSKYIERKSASVIPCVIIAPSGMLKGGTAIFYSEQLIFDEKNAIYLVSFQLPNTLGRQLLETQTWKDGKTKVQAEIKHFPLSSHSGRSELLSLVDSIVEKSNNKPIFYIVHGDEENSESLSEALEDKGLETVIPNKGEEFSLV